jgi:hypothetical protein
MQPRVVHRPRASPFQAGDDLVAVERVPGDDNVDVIGQNGASVDPEVDLAADYRKPAADSLSLDAAQLHRRVFQCDAYGTANAEIMRLRRKGMRRMDFGRFAAGLVNVLSADARRAAPARIVRRPKTVGAEDEVQAEHGG